MPQLTSLNYYNTIFVEHTTNVVRCTMEYTWNTWIRGLYKTEGEEYYTVAQWAESLIYEGLVPEMKKRGYVFSTNDHGVVNSFLNYLFHFENSYYAMKECQYIGKHGRTMDWSTEDYAYFLDYKCPPFVWKQLRDQFPIEHFSDEGDFSQSLWNDIPYAVFFMIDLKNSPSSDELEARIDWLDTDDEEERGQQRKRHILDPYLLDYGKDRYKYTEPDTRL